MHLLVLNHGIGRSLAMLAVAGVLVVPALASATTGATSTADGTGGDVGSGDGAGSEGGGTAATTAGGEGNEGSGSTASPTSGATSSGDTEGESPPAEDDKGCTIGSRGMAPGLLVLGLLGLHAIGRRRRPMCAN